MGIARGPNVINDGLVFGYDTGYNIADNDTATRFYPGETATNYLSSGLSSYNVVQAANWNGATPAFTLGTSEFGTPIGTYTTAGTSYMYSHDYVLDDDLSTLSAQTVTFSIYLKRSGGSNIGTVGIRVYDNISGYTTVYAAATSEFQRFTLTKTLGANPTRIFVMIDNTNGGVIDFHSPQLEIGSTASPFVDGSRSATQSLIDLKRTRDIDLSYMSFDSTGQPDMDGSNDYVDLGSDVEISSVANAASNGWTAEYVFNSDSASTLQHFNGCEEDVHNAGWLALLSSKLAVWDRSANVWKYGSTQFASNTWYHIAFVQVNGTTMQFYVNGVAESGDHASFSWTAAKSAFFARYIGRYEYNGYSRYFNGNVPVARLYSKALTASEITQNYKAHKNRFNI